jgi:hypothetical protein
MPTQAVTFYLPEEAVAQAQDAFEVVLEDWGTDATDRWPQTSLGGLVANDQEGFQFSPKAISLGPRSTVDRVWMSWNTQKQWPPPPSLQFEAFLQRLISLEAPMLFAQPAGRGIAPGTPPALTSPLSNAMRLGLIYFFPTPAIPSTTAEFPTGSGRIQSTLLPTNYTKVDGTVVLFGAGDSSPYFDKPVLHLLFTLKENLPSPNTKRFPYNVQGSTSQLDPDFQAEYPVAFVPVYGRKSIVVGVSGSEAGMIFRIGGLRGLNQFGAFETTEGQKTAAAAFERVKFHFCDECLDYIVIYATSAAVNLATTTTFTVSACD